MSAAPPILMAASAAFLRVRSSRQLLAQATRSDSAGLPTSSASSATAAGPSPRRSSMARTLAAQDRVVGVAARRGGWRRDSRRARARARPGRSRGCRAGNARAPSPDVATAIAVTRRGPALIPRARAATRRAPDRLGDRRRRRARPVGAAHERPGWRRAPPRAPAPAPTKARGQGTPASRARRTRNSARRRRRAAQIAGTAAARARRSATAGIAARRRRPVERRRSSPASA